MSNQNKQDSSDIFDAQDTDGTADDAVLPPEDNEGADNSSNSIELDGESKQDTAKPGKEVQEAKQVEAWTAKVLAGKASLDDLSGDLSWLKPKVESNLDKLSSSAPVLEKLVEKKFAEKEETQKFNTLRSQLNEVNTTKTQRQIIEAEFKDFKSAGLPQSKALEKAMKIAGVDPSSESAELFKSAARMPKASNYQQSLPKSLKEMNSSDRVAEYEKMRKSKQ
jgi:hypothetical protein